jgi:hypothetical protein
MLHLIRAPEIRGPPQISRAPHLPNAIFAIESLGRIGDSRPEVGDRLVQAITERWSLADGEDCPLRLSALWALESLGGKVRPWVPQLRLIRDSLQGEHEDGIDRTADEPNWKATAAQTSHDLALASLTRLIGEGAEQTAKPGEEEDGAHRRKSKGGSE